MFREMLRRKQQLTQDEIRRSGPGTLLLALTPAHMTGKLVKEA